MRRRCARANRAIKTASLIIGWGRIGKALTELLVGMNAAVTVASRSERGRNGAIERGAQMADTAELENALSGKQIVVFNAAGAGFG